MSKSTKSKITKNWNDYLCSEKINNLIKKMLQDELLIKNGVIIPNLNIKRNDIFGYFIYFIFNPEISMYITVNPTTPGNRGFLYNENEPSIYETFVFKNGYLIPNFYGIDCVFRYTKIEGVLGDVLMNANNNDYHNMFKNLKKTILYR